MARLVIVINAPGLQIADLNQRIQMPTHYDESVEGVIKLLEGIKSGVVTASTMQVTSRDTDPGVATSGAGSQQLSYSK